MALGWGIISTGRHVDGRIAPAINAAPEAELIGIYSRSQERAETYAKKHNAKAAYDQLDNLLNDSRVDAVFIASPNSLHPRHTIQSAKAGKHVFTEKTMATNLEDAIHMIHACRENDVKLGVGFHLRQHPFHIKASKLIAEGTIGPIVMAHAQLSYGKRGQVREPWRSGLSEWWTEADLVGGAFAMMANGVHMVDLLRFLIGEDVVEVSAMTDGQMETQPLEQLAQLSLRFAGGAITNVVCSRRIPDSRNDFTVYGVNGRIVGTNTTTIIPDSPSLLEVLSDSGDYTEEQGVGALSNYIAEMEDFRQAIEQDREPSASGIDGLRVVEVTQAMVESAWNKRSVRIDPIKI